MKEKGKTIFLVFLVVLFVGYLLVTAVLDLTNKKDIYTVNIDYAGEVLAIEHSIGGLIPIGKDHYYLGVDEDTMEAVFVKGSKNWLSKNFDSEGNALTAGGLTITSLAKKAGDFEVEQELRAVADGIGTVGFVVEAPYCLVLDYRFDAVMKLVLLVLSAFVAVWGVRIAKSEEKLSAVSAKIFLVVVVIDLVLLLRVLI